MNINKQLLYMLEVRPNFGSEIETPVNSFEPRRPEKLLLNLCYLFVFSNWLFFQIGTVIYALKILNELK